MAKVAKDLFAAFQPLNENEIRPPYRVPFCLRKEAVAAIREASPDLLPIAVFYSGYVLSPDEVRKVADLILSLLEPGCSTNSPDR